MTAAVQPKMSGRGLRVEERMPLFGVRRSAVLFEVVAAVVFLRADIAAASCGAPQPFPRAFASAPVVFTGTVVHLENGRRWATVDVDEVWKGDDVPAEAIVRAGPKDPPGPTNVISSVDRHYRLGTRYLFVPYRQSGSIFRDNNCTRTTPFRPALDRLRPPDARLIDPTVLPTTSSDASPESGPGEPSESSTPWPAIAVVVVAVGAAGTVFLLRRSR